LPISPDVTVEQAEGDHGWPKAVNVMQGISTALVLVRQAPDLPHTFWTPSLALSKSGAAVRGW
jgi:hypothetical protein